MARRVSCLGAYPNALPSGDARRSARTRRSIFAALAILISASGSSCPQMVRQYTQPVPRALPTGAPLATVIDVVNSNSDRVQSLSTTRATISIPGIPALNSNIAFQRPRSFRLVARTFIGPEVDLGSNDELLWFWIKHAQPPALFFCRHDQFATSAARQVMPVEPEWLIEAFGVVRFDPSDHVEGPFPVGNGRVEIRSKSRKPGDTTSRITIVDDSRGVVLEQHVYDANGARLASAILSKHARDPATEVTLPRHIEIQWPPAKFELSIDLADIHVNQLTADPRELFAKPAYSGYTEIDLAQPVGPLPPPAAAPAPRVQAAPVQARY
jgi:hypothetical protein